MSRPCHIVAVPGDRLTLCGVRAGRSEGLPYVAFAHVTKHVDGYGLELCAECGSKYDGLTELEEGARR